MDELLELMVDVVSKAGGEMTYEELMAEVPFEHRRSTPQAFKMLKAEGRLSKQIRLVEGKPAHIVYIP